jgi:hypothetical protein
MYMYVVPITNPITSDLEETCLGRFSQKRRTYIFYLLSTYIDICHGIGMFHDSSCLFYFLMLSGEGGGVAWGVGANF